MKNRPKTSETIAQNIKKLSDAQQISLDEIARRAGVTRRAIQYILSGERVPSIEMAESIGQALNVTGWQLLIPNLAEELARSGRLSALVSNYMADPAETQSYLESVAQRDAKKSNKH